MMKAWHWIANVTYVYRDNGGYDSGKLSIYFIRLPESQAITRHFALHEKVTKLIPLNIGGEGDQEI